VLLAIHYDTVFGTDHPFQSVTRVDQHTLRGPGVCDAKGGLLVLLHALLALERSPVAGGLAWEVLLNPDEELGSPGSGTLFAAAARRNDIGLVFEPALPDGSLVASRKGSGNFTFIARGRAAHAGRDAHLGRNAIHALASLVANVAALAREFPGISINTASIAGGGPLNIIPDLAIARTNVRPQTFEEESAFTFRLKDLIAAQPEGISIEFCGGFHCPPKPLTPSTERLLESLRDCAAQLDLALNWRPTGGVCDGNRLAAAGLPTVDSLGVRGGNMHTDQEFARLDSLTERTKLVTLLLLRLAAGEITLDRSPTTQEVLQA
jgi:glutamate carboxypeptidase